MEDKILEAFANGNALGLIAENLNITEEYILEVLENYKNECKYEKSFTEEFKRAIASRDSHGVSRRQISKELKISAITVKKACELFGQYLKEKSPSSKEYTVIEGDFYIDECPSCGSRRNNIVDEKTTFCMSCDSEHIYYDGYVKKINFEYIE